MIGLVLLLLALAAAAASVLSRDLFTAAISLGLASASLGTFYFLAGLDYAGAFELSTGAGLISVMLVSILSMMSRTSLPLALKMASRSRTLALVLCLLLSAGIASILVRQPAQAGPAASYPAGEASAWLLRSTDVIALGLLILAGAFGLSAMFHPEEVSRHDG